MKMTILIPSLVVGYLLPQGIMGSTVLSSGEQTGPTTSMTTVCHFEHDQDWDRHGVWLRKVDTIKNDCVKTEKNIAQCCTEDVCKSFCDPASYEDVEAKWKRVSGSYGRDDGVHWIEQEACSCFIEEDVD